MKFTIYTEDDLHIEVEQVGKGVEIMAVDPESGALEFQATLNRQGATDLARALDWAREAIPR